MRNRNTLLARFVIISAVCCLFRAGSTAPAPFFLDKPNTLGYVKYAPTGVVWNKLESYSRELGPGAVSPEYLRLLPFGAWNQAPFSDELDPNRSVVTLLLKEGSAFTMLSYLPLRSTGASMQRSSIFNVQKDHAFCSDNPIVLAKAPEYMPDFQRVLDEAPKADVRVALNASYAAEFKNLIGDIREWVRDLGFDIPLERVAEAEHATIDLQMGRDGLELQAAVYPKAGSALENLFSQRPVLEFPASGLIPADAAIRIVWKLTEPTVAGAAPPEGALAKVLPGMNAQSRLKVVKAPEDQAAVAKFVERIKTGAVDPGVTAANFDASYKANARTMDGIQINSLSIVGAAATPARAAADTLVVIDPSTGAAPEGSSARAGGLEFAASNGFLFQAIAAPVALDESIQKAMGSSPQPKALLSQTMYPGQGQIYGDIDPIAAQMNGNVNLLSLVTRLAPEGRRPEIRFANVSSEAAPPMTFALDLSDGVGRMKVFLPVALAKKVGRLFQSEVPTTVVAVAAAPAARAAAPAAAAGASMAPASGLAGDETARPFDPNAFSIGLTVAAAADGGARGQRAGRGATGINSMLAQQMKDTVAQLRQAKVLETNAQLLEFEKERMKVFDLDGDGKVQLVEQPDSWRSQNSFALIDENVDGVVDLVELTAIRIVLVQLQERTGGRLGGAGGIRGGRGAGGAGAGRGGLGAGRGGARAGVGRGGGRGAGAPRGQ